MQKGVWQSGAPGPLSPRELEATLLAANDLSVKEIAREMGIAPSTAQARLDSARFKLGMQKTLRGLCIEALRRGLIVPLSVLVCIALALAATQTDTRLQTQRTARAARTSRHEALYAPAACST